LRGLNILLQKVIGLIYLHKFWDQFYCINIVNEFSQKLIGTLLKESF